MTKLRSVQEFFSEGNNVIRTFTGKFVDPFNMTISDVDLEDIAHGLSNICRFGGQTTEPIPVLSHIYYGYQCICTEDVLPLPSDEEILHWLLHDATEAYIGDIPSPIKNRLYCFQTLEESLKKMILKHFGVKSEEPYLVKLIDEKMLRTEVFSIVSGKFPRLGKSQTSNRKKLKKWYIETVEKHYSNMILATK